MTDRFPAEADEVERSPAGESFSSRATLVGAEPLPPLVLDSTPAAAVGNRYEVQRVLGVGGMGEVLLSRDLRIGREVAFKNMRPDVAGNADFRTRFLREGRIQGQLDHPTVVPVYDLGVAPGGAPFFTMRRVTGLSLDRVIGALAYGDEAITLRFTLRRRLAVFQQICLGVQYAHSRGVVHRDLKPGNIMVGGWGETYILDWGLAKAPGEKGADGSRSSGLGGRLMGTPGYMAPEQATASESVDGRADVYSLGVILFELLALTALHDGPSPQAVLRSTHIGADARASERAPDRDVPPELDAVCVKATALESRHRYASARALYEAVEQFLEGQRDVDVRRRIAAKHARAASRAADDGTAKARELATREAGRALALDPESKDALALVMKLALSAPQSVPAGARARVHQEDQREQVMAAKVGVVVYGPIAIAAAVLGFLSGDMGLAGICSGALLVAVLLCAWLVHRPTVADAPYALATSACLAVAIAAAAVWFSPFYIVPQLAVANAISLNLRNLGSFRWLHLAMASLAIAVPSALEWAGILPNPSVFSDGTIELHTLNLSLPTVALPLAVFVLSSAAVAGAAVLLWRLDDNMAEQRVRLHRQLWHLRHLVPQVPVEQRSVVTADDGGA